MPARSCAHGRARSRAPERKTCSGRYRAGPEARLRAYLGGKPFAGNPASIVLRGHEEIVLAYGTKAQLPRPLPARYAFAAGL